MSSPAIDGTQSAPSRKRDASGTPPPTSPGPVRNERKKIHFEVGTTASATSVDDVQALVPPVPQPSSSAAALPERAERVKSGSRRAAVGIPKVPSGKNKGRQVGPTSAAKSRGYQQNQQQAPASPAPPDTTTSAGDTGTFKIPALPTKADVSATSALPTLSASHPSSPSGVLHGPVTARPLVTTASDSIPPSSSFLALPRLAAAGRPSASVVAAPVASAAKAKWSLSLHGVVPRPSAKSTRAAREQPTETPAQQLFRQEGLALSLSDRSQIGASSVSPASAPAGTPLVPSSSPCASTSALAVAGDETEVDDCHVPSPPTTGLTSSLTADSAADEVCTPADPPESATVETSSPVTSGSIGLEQSASVIATTSGQGEQAETPSLLEVSQRLVEAEVQERLKKVGRMIGWLPAERGTEENQPVPLREYFPSLRLLTSFVSDAARIYIDAGRGKLHVQHLPMLVPLDCAAAPKNAQALIVAMNDSSVSERKLLRLFSKFFEDPSTFFEALFHWGRTMTLSGGMPAQLQYCVFHTWRRAQAELGTSGDWPSVFQAEFVLFNLRMKEGGGQIVPDIWLRRIDPSIRQHILLPLSSTQRKYRETNVDAMRKDRVPCPDLNGTERKCGQRDEACANGYGHFCFVCKGTGHGALVHVA